jgi:hypothetical protein
MKTILREYYELTTNKEYLTELKHADQSGDPFIVTGVIQRANAKNQNGRIYPRAILEKECKRYDSDYVTRGIALGELDHCLPGDYEVLTESGWKKLPDVELNENVYTLNDSTGKIELCPTEKTHKFMYKGHMIRLTNGKKMDLLMTPNHRMLLEDRYGKKYYTTAMDANEAWINGDSKLSHSKILASGLWEGTSPSYFNIPNTEYNVPIKAWAGMFGLWLAEGHVQGSKGGPTKGHAVVIHQKKEKNIQKIRDLLSATELPWTERQNKDGKHEWRIGNKEIHSYFSQFGNSSTKFIPREFLNWNTNLLSLMLDWMLLGDGRNRSNPGGEIIKEYSSVSSRLIDDVSEIYFKLGNRPFIKKDKKSNKVIGDRVLLAENAQQLYTVGANTSETYLDQRFIKFEQVEYDDFVYCISTKNLNFLVRSSNGYVCWTGNTEKPVVEYKNASHRIKKLWWEGDEVKGDIEILDTPAGLIARKIVLAGIPLGISSRAIGSVSKSEAQGADVVQEDLQLVCFDLVCIPSTHGAFLKVSTESEQKVLTGDQKVFSEGKEKSGVYKILQDILNLKQE